MTVSRKKIEELITEVIEKHTELEVVDIATGIYPMGREIVVYTEYALSGTALVVKNAEMKAFFADDEAMRDILGDELADAVIQNGRRADVAILSAYVETEEQLTPFRFSQTDHVMTFEPDRNTIHLYGFGADLDFTLDDITVEVENWENPSEATLNYLNSVITEEMFDRSPLVGRQSISFEPDDIMEED